ncbi:MAG: hypothetical protein U0520_05205 [Candidatus Saccharimonadales bacterium]
MAKKAATKRRSRAARTIEVKQHTDIIRIIDALLVKNMHDRYTVRLSEKTREMLVAYGPWLAIGLLAVIAPELMVLAKSGRLISATGFLEKVLFNRESWVLLMVVFINIICFVDALSDLFEKTKRGWDRVYLAILVNLTYVLYQLATNPK